MLYILTSQSGTENVFLSELYIVYKVFERSLANAYIESSLVYVDILNCL